MANVTIKLVRGENYIGRGYHFRKGDTAEMTKKAAVPFLRSMVNQMPRFQIVDEEMDALMESDITDTGDVPVSPEKVSGKPVQVNPKNFTEPKMLRQWLRDNGIQVANNATMERMVPLIPDNWANMDEDPEDLDEIEAIEESDEFEETEESDE